jgi:uncharacterized protein
MTSASRATIPTLLFALAAPPLLVVVSRRLFGPTPPLAIEVLLQAVFCAMVAVVLLAVVYLERLPLTSIGLRRPDWRTVVAALLLAAAVLVILPLMTDPLVAALRDRRVDVETRALGRWPLWLKLFVASTSGFVEETLYRGYAVERLAMLSGRRWLGAGLAALVFALAHTPAWGLGFALAVDLPFAMVMTIFYLWRRDLVANGLAHSTALVIALWSLP